MSKENEPSFYAVIPANVRYCKDITSSSKLLYGEITSLCHKEGYCWASNSYFAELYGVSIKTVSTWVKELITFGFISSEIVYKEGTNEIVSRYLRLCAYPTHEKVHTPTHKNVKDNSKVINTKFNNKKEEEKEEPTAAAADNDDVPFFVKEQREKITPPRGAGEISREALKADFSENDYCRMQAGREGIQKDEYENIVNEFILEKFGLEENTKWKDIKDARSHFVRWIPYFKSKTQKQNEGSTKNTGYSNSLRSIDNKNRNAAF